MEHQEVEVVILVEEAALTNGKPEGVEVHIVVVRVVAVYLAEIQMMTAWCK